jgi:hypothetical protein
MRALAVVALLLAGCGGQADVGSAPEPHWDGGGCAWQAIGSIAYDAPSCTATPEPPSCDVAASVVLVSLSQPGADGGPGCVTGTLFQKEAALPH